MAFQYGYYGNPYSPGVFNAPTAPAQFASTNIPNIPAANTNTQGYVCRPVTSKAEAEVFQIPFDGSTTYFVDTSNGNIYSKAFDFQTGTAPVSTYVKETVPLVQYATIDDLNALREELTKKGKAVKKNDSDEQ